MTANATTETTDYNGYTDQDLQSNSESLYTSLSAFTDEEIAQYMASGDEVTIGAVESWSTIKDDLGDYVGIGTFTVEDGKDAITTQLVVDYSESDLLLTVIYDEELTVTSITAEKEYSLSETMSKAGLNILMGMGTVFVILILIAFLISGFTHINKWEENMKIKNNNKNKSVTPIVPVVEEELVDDLEIVAVISAAIAATMNTSTDGFVVRSIKRRTSKTR
jgi:sodium pump decarboxylase gamma subunit